ncbi:hypothetical protein [Gynurincola endophyticus]|uniref:hypothetical protein n=1 Tax=Gynurincola endophyticus TaxID=2479004 RepID=UPI000F8EBEF6|nr:hypothetical protein [Gynurincola endophyticus]
MKQVFSLLLVVTVFFSCTKENNFLEKPTFTSLSINTTASVKKFDVWLDEELLKDSISSSVALSNVTIVAGEHRLRISQAGLKDFFIDTVLHFDWQAKSPAYTFSLIELDSESDPLFFTGFSNEIPAHENGYVTIGFLNIDPTPISFNKDIDLIIYDASGMDPDKIIAEFNDIPYNKISSYHKIPVDVFNNGGMMVIRDAESKEILFDGRELFGFLFLGSYWPGAPNTYLLKFYNVGDELYPYYLAETIFSALR